MKRSHWLWALLIGGVAAYFLLSGGGPEDEIRTRLAEVEELLEKRSGEASLAAVDRANRLTGHFTEEFSVVVEPYGQSFASQRDLIRGFVAMRRAYDSISVGLELRDVRVAGSQAESRVRATFLGAGGGGGPSRESWDAVVLWRNEGGWKIEDVRVTGRSESAF